MLKVKLERFPGNSSIVTKLQEHCPGKGALFRQIRLKT